MEPAQKSITKKVRIIKEERIKCLNGFHVVSIIEDNTMSKEIIYRELGRQMGEELFTKILQFNKIERIERVDGLIGYFFKLDVIVPESVNA